MLFDRKERRQVCLYFKFLFGSLGVLLVLLLISNALAELAEEHLIPKSRTP